VKEITVLTVQDILLRTEWRVPASTMALLKYDADAE